MLSPRENVLRTINNENAEYVPLTMEAFRIVGMPTIPAVENPLMESGYDPFGIFWHVDGMGALPDNKQFMFEEVSDWKDYVKFPDINQIDFKIIADQELATIDRSQQVLTYYHPNGIWERLTAFVGFENALIGLLDEPEACHDFFDAFVKYKITVAKKIIDVYNPDVYVDFSDFSSARGTLMSLDTFRDVIKPHQKEFAQYINSRGVIFEQHSCGKCETLIGDFIDIGAKMWHSAQPMNNIADIQKKFKGVLAIEGGWDTQGVPGTIAATDDDVRQEVRRCIDEYGKNGGFILSPNLVTEEGMSFFTGRDSRLAALMDEYNKYRTLS